MIVQTSLKLIKIPAVILAIGFLVFCLPRIVHADNNDSKFNLTHINRGQFRLSIAIPKGQSPEGGWPVIVLLDGNNTFPIALSFAPKAAIIGIGYPTGNKSVIVAKRYYDLTSKAPESMIPGPRDQPKPKTGGEAEFRRFIFDKALPFIAKKHRIDLQHVTLYGHSLGGYFVLKTLLSDDANKVNNFCASDPSIWWSNHELWQQIKQFDKNSVGPAHLMIDVAEKKVNHQQLSDDEQKRINALRQGPNGRNISEFLRTQKRFDNLFRSYANESHGTLIEFSIADCLNFAFGSNVEPEPNLTR